VAEPAALAAGDGEAGGVGGHRQVGAGDELAPGGGGQPVHPGDDHLRHGLDGVHQLGAQREQPAHEGQVGAGHVGEVVTGGEDRPVGGQDHAPGVRLAGGTQCGQQLGHQLERQGVAALRPVQRDRGERPVALHQDVLSGVVAHPGRTSSVGGSHTMVNGRPGIGPRPPGARYCPPVANNEESESRPADQPSQAGQPGQSRIPTFDEMVNSEQFAIAVGLFRRAMADMQERSERMTRRFLHAWNIPTGSDVTRLVRHLDEMERQVQSLTEQLEKKESAGRPKAPAVKRAARPPRPRTSPE
jgi:hypothetical protein